MSVDFEAWTNQTRATRVYLVELTLLKKADLSTVTLYLSTHAYPDAAVRRGIAVDKPYRPCVKGIPRLTRTATTILQPDRVPSWGELSLFTKPDYKPDLAGSLTWSTLLSGAYTAWGQPVVIRLGDPSWDYADFQVIFSGRCGNLVHDDITATLTLFDKSTDFTQKYPDYELPANDQVVESNWNKAVWLILGCVKNYKPVLISNSESGTYPYQYALACHVLNALTAVYLNGAETTSPGNWEFIQKGLSPVNKDDAAGAATLQALGPYTGELLRGNWLIEIDSIITPNSHGNSGSEVGLATFRWSMDGGDTWLGEGILTWKLAYDSATLSKAPAVGPATIIVSGDYTDDIKRIYRVRVVTGGHIGGTPAPQFVWSDDNGATWSDPVDILDSEPIPLSQGFSVAFPAVAGFWTYNNNVSWSGETGMMAVHSYVDGVAIEILNTGAVGTDIINYNWTYGESSGSGLISDSNPIEVFAGFEVAFSGSLNGGDTGSTSTSSFFTDAFVVDDMWIWGIKEIPVPLADGVSVQFSTHDDQDFYAGDKFTFILMSLLSLRGVEETTEVTVDAEGLESPVTGAYTDLVGEMIRGGAILLLGWNSDDFDTAAMASFNAAFPYQAGLGVESPTEFGEIIKKLLGGIPAIYSMTLEGKFRLAELTPPAGAPVLIINDTNILGRPQHGDSEEDKKIYRRVYLTYDRNYNPGLQVSGVTQERLEWLKNETRIVSARDDNVKKIYSLASDLGPLDSCLIKREDAMTVANKDLLLFKEEWDSVSVDLKTQPYIREIGESAELRRARFGLDAGKLLNIHGLDLDFAANKSTLKLWG